MSAGCSDGTVVEAVLSARRAGRREVIRMGADPSGEVSCTGSIDVLIDPDPPEITAERAVATLLPDRPETPPRSRLLIAGGRLASGTLGSDDLDAELVLRVGELGDDAAASIVRAGPHLLLVERDRRPQLVIVGAGDIGVHLAKLASDVGYRVVVVDSRAAFATPERFPDAYIVRVGWVDELADEIGIDRGSAVVAIAHDPKQDDPAITVALRRGARYVGALGSRRAHAARLERLGGVGFTRDDLARIHAPIGLDLGATTSAEMAASILAELIRVRRRETSPNHVQDGL